MMAAKQPIFALALAALVAGTAAPMTASFAATGSASTADQGKAASESDSSKTMVQQAPERPAAPSSVSDQPKNPLTGAPAPTSPAVPAQPNSGQAAPDQSNPDDAAAILDAPSGEIIRDMSQLPAPVRQMRDKIIEAAASGDIQRLRPLVNIGPNQTLVMNADSDDPVEMLKSFAGDADGQEILAIFIDLLSTAAVRLEAGKPDEVYVWPYFAGTPLSSLTPPERVELLRIITAGDLLGMEETGTYNFYRIGISPDGQWKFVAGGE